MKVIERLPLAIKGFVVYDDNIKKLREKYP